MLTNSWYCINIIDYSFSIFKYYCRISQYWVFLWYRHIFLLFVLNQYSDMRWLAWNYQNMHGSVKLLLSKQSEFRKTIKKSSIQKARNWIMQRLAVLRAIITRTLIFMSLCRRRFRKKPRTVVRTAPVPFTKQLYMKRVKAWTRKIFLEMPKG